MTDEPKKHRFLTTTQAAEELNVSPDQIRALLKTGDLRAIQVGRRNYLAHLMRLTRGFPGIAGDKRGKPREVSVRFVRVVGRRHAGIGA